MAEMDEKALIKYLLQSQRINPWVTFGVPIAGSAAAIYASEQARRRAEAALGGLQKPVMERIARNPLLAQRIASQMRIADQPRMEYQRAFDEQAARGFGRARDVAANLGGGMGLAYLQQAASNAAEIERTGIYQDMEQQRKSRMELDQLINMRNQEIQQERAIESQRYAQEMQNYINERRGLQADISQQKANTWASVGNLVQSIPGMFQQYFNAKAAEALLNPKTTGTTTTTSGTTSPFYRSMMRSMMGKYGQSQADQFSQPIAPLNKDLKSLQKEFNVYRMSYPDPTRNPFDEKINTDFATKVLGIPPHSTRSPLDENFLNSKLFPNLYIPESYFNQRLFPELYTPSYIPYIQQTQSPIFIK